MRISLNLLSPTQKEALETRVIYALVERFMLLLIASALVVTGALVGIRMSLNSQLTDIVSRQVLSKEYASVNEETARLNDIIVRVQRLQALSMPATEVLFDIFQRTPTLVRLNGLAYDADGGAMTLSGVAETRDALLSYEESLRGSPYVKSLESPVSNLFEKTNVNFTLQAVIKLPPPPAENAATSTAP